MRSSKLTLLVCAGLLLTLPKAGFSNAFENKGKQLAAEIVTNPAQFFFDFHKDFESLNPLPPGKWFGINWHIGQFLLLPIPDPTTINLSGKLKLASESKLFAGSPQIDLIGGYWTLGPLLDGAVEKNPTPGETSLTGADFSGMFAGAVMTTSLEPRVRLFWGYKYSKMKAELTLSEKQSFLGSEIDSFNTGFKDHFLFAGLETPTATRKLWNIQFFYGLQTRDFGAKVSWYKKNFELGLNIYPEGTFVIHPVLNFHINFG